MSDRRRYPRQFAARGLGIGRASGAVGPGNRCVTSRCVLAVVSHSPIQLRPPMACRPPVSFDTYLIPRWGTAGKVETCDKTAG